MSGAVARPRLQVGGTVPLDRLYLRRPADDELPAALMRGELCYVLAPRQMGKSSLRLRAQRELEQKGVRCAAVDLTTVGGKTSDAAAWYFSVIDGICQGLKLPEARAYWEGRGAGTPVQGFVNYIRQEVAAQASGPVVIFIDELDGLLALEHVSRDEFLAAVRALHNLRADDEGLRQVTFCLLGAALPGDLMEDERLTPFNIGRGIVLGDFGRADLRPLEAALGGRLDEVYEWTAGHPFMTMKLCEAVLEAEEDEEEGGGDVTACVNRLFLSGGRVKEVSLAYAERYFERREGGGLADRVDQMLWLYGRLLGGEAVAARAQDPVQGSLGLSGLVAERDGQLAVRNRIMRQVFDAAWVKKQQAERLFTGPLQKWLESGRKGEHLLRGEELEAALAWAADRGDIAAEERQFLLASQAARGEEQVAEVLREQAIVLRRRNIGLMVALAGALALLVVSILMGLRAQQREIEAQRAAAKLAAAANLAEQKAKEAAEASEEAERREAEEAKARSRAKAAEKLATDADKLRRVAEEEAKKSREVIVVLTDKSSAQKKIIEMNTQQIDIMKEYKIKLDTMNKLNYNLFINPSAAEIKMQKQENLQTISVNITLPDINLNINIKDDKNKRSYEKMTFDLDRIRLCPNLVTIVNSDNKICAKEIKSIVSDYNINVNVISPGISSSKGPPPPPPSQAEVPGDRAHFPDIGSTRRHP